MSSLDPKHELENSNTKRGAVEVRAITARHLEEAVCRYHVYIPS
jgi:hypothetical protein